MRIGMSWLDVKLGIRMLLKYPGLTIAGGLALAIAIGIGAAWFDLTGDVMRPKLPLPDGDRIVEIEMRDSVKSRTSAACCTTSSAGGGTSGRSKNSAPTARSSGTSSRGTASGSRDRRGNHGIGVPAHARPPLLGRPLLESDEQPGAPPVVVLGYPVWQGRFAGRADAIGQTLQLGRTETTVVGVMPEGFAFPINHRMWVPLQLQPSGYGPLEGAGIRVFGRLAPGSTQAQANTEVVSLVERTAAASPQTHEHLRPARAGVRRRVSRRPVVVRVLLDASADPAGPDRGVRERRNIDLRPHRDARRGDRRAPRARRRARPDRRPVVRRSTRPRRRSRPSPVSSRRTSR